MEPPQDRRERIYAGQLKLTAIPARSVYRGPVVLTKKVLP